LLTGFAMAKRNDRGLTERRDRFVGNYLADLKRRAGPAARKAGYANPDQPANRLLKNPVLIAEIRRRTAPQIRKLEITGERVLQEIAACAFASLSDFVVIDQDGQPRFDFTDAHEITLKALSDVYTETTRIAGEEGEAGLVSVTKTRIKMHDKLKALEILARHLKLINAEEVVTPRQAALVIVGAPAKVAKELAALKVPGLADGMDVTQSAGPWGDVMRVELSLRFSWRNIGDVELDQQGKLRFPRAPSRPGIYRFDVAGVSGKRAYIGETDTLDRRFQHYRTPGPTQSTNIRLNALMSEVIKAGGRVSVSVMTDGAVVTVNDSETQPRLDIKSDRVMCEQAAIFASRENGLSLVNV